jgi:predicted nicotinamide N-methyase
VSTRAELPAEWDVLLASDVVYEVGVIDQLLALSRSRRLIVAEPMRPTSPRLPFEHVASYRVQCWPDVDYPTNQAVVYDVSEAQR